MNERAIILALFLMPLVGARLGCGEGAHAEEYGDEGDEEPASPSPPELSALLDPEP